MLGKTYMFMVRHRVCSDSNRESTSYVILLIGVIQGSRSSSGE